MQFQSYKIADLIPASYNPRKKLKPGDKEYEKIKNSIKEFGYVEPIIINSDMTIIGGHQRATVLADLGYTEVECIVVDIDKIKEKALNVALNKITGEWNKELLADLIKDLEDSDFDVGITGFEPPEIEQLFNSVHDKKITEDDFDVEAELAKPTVAKTGDVWLLGKHRVICGDSILPETYDKLMDGQKANLVLTDPPYNVNVEETAGKIKNDNMPDEDFYKFLFAAFVNMEQSMEQDASIYVFHADTEGLNFRKARHSRMPDFTFLGAASGRRTHWSLEEARTSGSMSRACSDGRKAGSTSGIPTGSRPPSGNMTVRRQARTIRP